MPIFSSSPIVTATLWLLIVFSMATWGLIFLKIWDIFKISRTNRAYLDDFWSAQDLAQASRINHVDGPLLRIAQAGFRILEELQQGATHDLGHSGGAEAILERSLRQHIQRERNRLEQGLTLLASIGSTAPFIGLFGTVWGIMHALSDIGKANSASLDVVAGPIGETLIATAIGIATAIPAVLAYNFFLRRIRSMEIDMEHFTTDFLHLVILNNFKVAGD